MVPANSGSLSEKKSPVKIISLAAMDMDEVGNYDSMFHQARDEAMMVI